MSSVYITSSTPKSKPVVFPGDFKVYQVWEEGEYDEQTSWALDAGHHGRISIVDRRTGFGHRDIETGFRDTWAMNARGKGNYGKNFWLASGQFDIRHYVPVDGLSFDEAVEQIKLYANTCIGKEDNAKTL